MRITARAATLRPDMTANVSIRTTEREAVVVPTASVQREAGERFVWIERGGELVRREVATGTRDAGYTEIRRGLAGGERVLAGPFPAPAPKPGAP
ncbi:MAG: hypothetical protein U1F11_12765 [Steroidobacteraceae bacterium]